MSAQVMEKIHKNLRREEHRDWAQKVKAAAGLVKAAGMRVGTSVLFGLDGETRTSIDETISGVSHLIDEALIDLASPNVLTYHPATPITRLHGMVERLDYHSPHVDNRKPYIYFEEAFPGVVSTSLTEDDLWYIHHETERRWGATRNDSAHLPEEDPPRSPPPRGSRSTAAAQPREGGPLMRLDTLDLATLSRRDGEVVLRPGRVLPAWVADMDFPWHRPSAPPCCAVSTPTWATRPGTTSRGAGRSARPSPGGCANGSPSPPTRARAAVHRRQPGHAGRPAPGDRAGRPGRRAHPPARRSSTC
ncbi:hypothetical protein NKH77_09190 [Streptomyces sp. M19]